MTLKPIPLNADSRDRERYVHNILAAYERTTPEQRAAGAHWYSYAHGLAVFLADSDGPAEIRRMAGVIAALSANKSWAQNVKLATDAADGDVHGHTEVMLGKVRRMLNGADPEDELPMYLKTGQFFRCILDPEDADAVVIDRHAHDIAVGYPYGNANRGLQSSRRYALLAHCYREAALRLGILPQELQAIVWVAHTEALAGTGTRTMEHAPQDHVHTVPCTRPFCPDSGY